MVPMREKFSAKQMRFLRSAFRWGLSQAPNFKFYGAEFYFKQIGLQSRFSSLMRFDFLNMLEQDLSARDGFVFLCNLAVGRKEG